MFSFNRNEQIAILLLSGALLAGGVVTLLDRYAPDRIPDFEVRKGAVAVPSDTAVVSPGAMAGQVYEPPPREAALAPIDLNRASLQDLQQLPGIGPQIARRIVDYRTQHGPFRTLEDLAAVRGIGARTLERLRPLVTLTSP